MISFGVKDKIKTNVGINRTTNVQKLIINVFVKC